MSEGSRVRSSSLLAAVCALILITYGLMIDLKGVDSDEGIRLGISNGGEAFLMAGAGTGTSATWAQVLQTSAPFAYQPVYFLLQNGAMRLGRSHDVVFLRLINVFFLWLCLRGLIALSPGWPWGPRLFTLGLFSFNAYLFMHVLQLREYILSLAIYVWSSWLVLKLDRRELGREWLDVAWFAAYGALLILGFYTQSWVVFPAMGQGLFLILRPGRAKLRFYAYLAVSYVTVLSFTWPYLQSHHEKVDVGRWGQEGTALWPQLSQGFHLVLAGQAPGQSAFADFVFWFWLAVMAAAAGLLFRKSSSANSPGATAEFKRQGLLMTLSMLVPFAFQVGYFWRVDNLSVWPRYFIVHYFFLTWLVALAFKFLSDQCAAPRHTPWPGRVLQMGLVTATLVMVTSAVFQTRSYYRDPLLDTSLSPTSNWRAWAIDISRLTGAGDVVVTYDFISRATLTFTRPMPNRILVLQDLDARDLHSTPRLVYLESYAQAAQRGQLVARMAALGFGRVEEFPIHSADGKSVTTLWRVLAFSRQ